MRTDHAKKCLYKGVIVQTALYGTSASLYGAERRGQRSRAQYLNNTRISRCSSPAYGVISLDQFWQFRSKVIIYVIVVVVTG